MTGLIVDRVDVTVHDVNLPEQETEIQQTQQYDEPVNYQAANPSLGQ